MITEDDKMMCCKMKRIVVWFCVLVVALVAQTQNSDKVDMKTFLENIKKMLQETVEKMRKQQENRMKRRKDKKNKIKTRKMLMNKLANPYLSFRREHTIIDYKKRPDTQSNRSNLQESDNELDGKTGRISPQTVKKVLKSNPVFNPLRTDRLKDILSKIQRPQGNVQNSSTSSGNTEADPQTLRYERGLGNWLDEVYSKIDWFWDTVYRLFILDEKRFGYLSEVLCKDEITIPSWWYNSSVDGCSSDNLPDRSKVIRLDKPTNMRCNSLDPHKLKVDTKKLSEVITCVEDKYIAWSIYYTGQCTLSLYTNAKLIENKGQEMVIRAEGIRPAYTSGKSLCYNLAALNFFGYKNKLYNILSFNPNKEDEINYISSKAGRFILYVQFMEKIFKEKIIPAVVDMCHIKCLCEDIGIGCTKQQEQQIELSQEEKVIIILWNIQKDGYLPYIDSLSKLVSFKEELEEGKVTICDKMQNDFKRMTGNIGKDIVEKRDKLIEMKRKIGDMERKGQVAPSVYVETVNLVEEVREELITVRERLIKLWQNRIESAISLDDLICVLDSFKILISNISVNNKNVLGLYLSDLSSGNGAKTKGLSKFIKIMDSVNTLYALYVSFQSTWDIKDLFKWVSALDYSIYTLTTTFNALKCVIGSVTIEEFLDYLESHVNTGIRSRDAAFLKCFMSGVKTIKQCAPKEYGVIEDIIEPITIDNLGNLKNRIENLEKEYKNKKWGDIPAIKDCCGDGCKNISFFHVTKWCEALTSPIFNECCKGQLGKCCDRTKPDCNPSSEPFCLNDDPDKVKMQCNSGSPSIAGDGSRCKNLSDKLESLFSISYNNNTRRIFCDVIEKYADFCSKSYKFINDITDNSNTSVMANAGYLEPREETEVFIKYGQLKCECVKCSVISQDICDSPIFIEYTNRDKMEKFLERAGLLEEAQKAIEGGLLKNLGKCPFK